MKTVSLACLSLLFSGLGAHVARAEITLAGGRAALTLSEEAVPRSLTLTADGAECLDRTKPEPLAAVLLADGGWRAANRASLRGGELTLGFDGTEATVTLAVDAHPHGIALRIAACGGPRPKAVRFVALDSAFTESVGQRLNIGWNAAHALCVMALTPQVQAQFVGQPRVGLRETLDAVGRGEGGVLPRVRLTATAYEAPGQRLEGAAAAIVACATPDFSAAAEQLARAYGLAGPAGFRPAALAESERGSCLVVHAGAADAERLVRLCAEAGVRRVVLSADAWCASPESVAVNTALYPKGADDLGALAARLKSAGLAVGLQGAVPAAAKPEAASRLADLCGAFGFDLLDFGGPATEPARAEAADAFQSAVLARLRRPAAVSGPLTSQRLWHALARSPSAAPYLDVLRAASAEPWPTVRQHVDASVDALLDLRANRVWGDLGPFGVWPRQQLRGRALEGLQLDEFEYLLCRAVAFDCPVSLQLRLDELARNPLAPELLRLFSAYEAARLSGGVSEAVRAPMREPGKDFTLLRRQGLGAAFVPVRPVSVGGSRDVRATVGAFEKGAVATFWCAAGGAEVTLDLSPAAARVADFDDQRVVVRKSADGQLLLPVGAKRLTLRCPTLSAAALEQKVRAACVKVSAERSR